MNRRAFFSAFLALPLARLLPKSIFRQRPEYSGTLLDVARAQKPNLLPVVEALSQKNAFLQDAVWTGYTFMGMKVMVDNRLPPNVVEFR